MGCASRTQLEYKTPESNKSVQSIRREGCPLAAGWSKRRVRRSLPSGWNVLVWAGETASKPSHRS